jgi:PilX N-terminal
MRYAALPRHDIVANDRGATLVFTLLVLFTLLSLTVASLLATTSDLKISGNYQTGTQALLTAESGILHAQESINEVGVVSSCQSEIVANWSSIFTSSAVTVQGYPLLNYTVTAATDATDPAGHMLLNAVGQAPNESQRSIQARLATDTVFSPGAIYLPGNSVTPNFNGNSFLVDGHDTNLDGSPNPSGDAPGIAARTQSSVDSVTNALSGQQADNVIGQGGMPSVKMSNGFTTSQLLNQIVPGIASTPGVVTNPSLTGNDTFGTQASPQITHFTGDVTVSGNLSGFGVLLVDGGLTISGSSTFTGLIIVQGTTDITTVQGNTTILGSIWTTDLRLTVGGSASVTYSSQALAQVDALGLAGGLLPKRVKVVAWKE